MKTYKIVVLFLFLGLFSCAVKPIKNNNMKKIALTEGNIEITHEDLHLKLFFQKYDHTAKKHLIDDVYLRVNTFVKDETIADFYVDYDKPKANIFLTKIYKNYFLSLVLENGNYFLSIEKAKINTVFAIQKEGVIDDLKIEITNVWSEWGTENPEPDANQFHYIHQTFKLSVGKEVKEINFCSCDASKEYFIEIANYKIFPGKANIQPYIIALKIEMQEQ